jgi:uncharacterized membrane-anchored protein
MVRSWLSIVILLGSLLSSPWALGQDNSQDNSQSSDAQEQQQRRQQLQALHWQAGPITATVSGNSTLKVPEGYDFLDPDETAKFEELTHNLAQPDEVLVTPHSHSWVAYLDFSDAGLVKDDEKIDADALLAQLRSGQEEANAERRRRGWVPLHVVGWAVPPAYNSATKRLEWATILEEEGDRSVNFLTKILGRRGYTTVVLACDENDRPAAVAQLNQLLQGYSFDSGQRYADWRPGDKVAAYGLGALVLGGAAVAATKTGLLKGLFVALAAAWKIIVVAVAGALAYLRSLFTRKKPQNPLNPL